MGLIHTPRVIFSIAKGLLARSRQSNQQQSSRLFVGLGDNIHSYYARAGLFDVDYLGHLNNAAYLNHAEMARWELSAENGLFESLAKTGATFLVANTTIRYRREIRPLFRTFQIDSNIVAMNDRYLWILHNFRYPIQGRSRVRAQIILKGVIAHRKEGVLNPTTFLKDTCGFDIDQVDGATLPELGNETVEHMLERFSSLEYSLREAAAIDDKTHEGL